MDKTAAESSDSLGVLHLERFYVQCLASKRGTVSEKSEDDWRFDNIVLAGLGLPLESTIQYVIQSEPTFAEFEKWILATNDGSIDALRIERINSAISGKPHSQRLNDFLKEIEESPDVLPADDLRFWDENGYVIVREAVSREQAKAAEDAVWEFLGMSPDNADTWYERQIGKGIMTEFYHHPALSATRGSERIHKAFAQLWKTADLWMTTDRTSFNPPENKRFTFPGPRLHWDMSLAPPHYFGTQGLLYLCDTEPDQGAFRCVPGFHRDIGDWLAALPAETDPCQVDLDERAVPIGAKAGDFVIWHQALPHGSSPNRGSYPRIVQYINMYPLDREENLHWL